MQGSGLSSDKIWTAFDTETTAATRHIRSQVKIAWIRDKAPTVSFATIGTSIIGGPDIVQGQFTAVTDPDHFNYFDESEVALDFSYDRIIEEPLGGLAYARGNVVLDNTNMRFTPNFNTTIGTAIQPKRPVKLFAGIRVTSFDQDKVLPVLYALSGTPMEDKVGRVTRMPLEDFVSFINDFELETTMFEGQRSDQIIASLLATMGFTTGQYELDEGLNTIGFAWFEKGSLAGNAIRKICEAEEATFYQDEGGILRFENRRHILVAPHNEVVWTFNKEDILDWREDNSSPIINRVRVKSSPREVQALTEAWKLASPVEVPTGMTQDIWATFENPVSSLTAMAATTDYIFNSASDGSGIDLTALVNISTENFASSAKITVENVSGVPAFATLLRLRGTPAAVVSEIQEMYEDLVSQDKYDKQELVIINDFIIDESFAAYIARAIVNKYKDPNRRLKLLVRGVAQLQLKDRVNVQDLDTGIYTEYRVMRIEGRMNPGGFLQHITVRAITSSESDTPAIIGIATIDGNDIVWI